MTESTTPEPVTIDVVSDVVCPWCFMGKRRLAAALAMRPDVPVEIRWRPFQLDPTIPPEGMDRLGYMTRKFGPEKIREIHTRLEEAGREIGIPFAFERIARSPNTLDAHRLVRWSQGPRQDAVVEALFSAYFIEGQDISDRDLLIRIGAAHGLDAQVVRARLEDGTDRGAVQEEVATAVRIGVSGVPFFIFAGRFGVPGAQSSDVLAAAHDKARTAEPVEPTTMA